MKTITPIRIILHHSLTKDSKTVSIGAIRKYHTSTLGWSDIGYHFLIERMRDDIEIVCGRMLDKKGAHCHGHNTDSIGICFVGNYDLEKPSKEIWTAGVKLVAFLMKEYEITDIQGHHYYNPNKSCPGILFNIKQFKEDCLNYNPRS